MESGARQLTAFLLVVSSYILYTNSLPISLPEEVPQIVGFQQFNDSNGTAEDLVIIKTVVYEVGILTDIGNDSSYPQTQDQVDLTFFNPSRNETTINLGNIPFPVQTNISGISLTGLAPLNFGTISIPKNEQGTNDSFSFNYSSPSIPQAFVSFTHNNGSSTNFESSKSILNEVATDIQYPPPFLLPVNFQQILNSTGAKV